MRDVLAKMRECGKDVKMRYFPHDCGMVDTYDIIYVSTSQALVTIKGILPAVPGASNGAGFSLIYI